MLNAKRWPKRAFRKVTLRQYSVPIWPGFSAQDLADRHSDKPARGSCGHFGFHIAFEPSASASRYDTSELWHGKVLTDDTSSSAHFSPARFHRAATERSSRYGRWGTSPTTTS